MLGGWLNNTTTAASSSAAGIDARGTSHVYDYCRLWHWESKIQFADSMSCRRHKLRVEVAGSGITLVERFYFDQDTTVWELRAKVLAQLDEGFECRLFYGSNLERELLEYNARLAEIIFTSTRLAGDGAPPVAGANRTQNIVSCVYASPFRIDDRKILLRMGCGYWAAQFGWTQESERPLARWTGIGEAKGNAVVHLSFPGRQRGAWWSVKVSLLWSLPFDAKALAGRIPTEIGQFLQLKQLRLVGNQLTGESCS